MKHSKDMHKTSVTVARHIGAPWCDLYLSVYASDVNILQHENVIIIYTADQAGKDYFVL